MKNILLALTITLSINGFSQSLKLISEYQIAQVKDHKPVVSELGKVYFYNNSRIFTDGAEIDLKTLSYKEIPGLDIIRIYHVIFNGDKLKLLFIAEEKKCKHNAIYTLELSANLKPLNAPVFIQDQTGDNFNCWHSELFVSRNNTYSALLSYKLYQEKVNHYEIAALNFDDKLNVVDSTRTHLDPSVTKYQLNAVLTSKGHLLTVIKGGLYTLSENSLIPLTLDLDKKVTPRSVYENSNKEWIITATYQDEKNQGTAFINYNFDAESVIDEKYIPFKSDFSTTPAALAAIEYSPNEIYSKKTADGFYFVYAGTREFWDAGNQYTEVRNILMRHFDLKGELLGEEMQTFGTSIMGHAKAIQVKMVKNDLFVFTCDKSDNYDASGNYKPTELKKNPTVFKALDPIYMKFPLNGGPSERRMFSISQIYPKFNPSAFSFVILNDPADEEKFIFYGEDPFKQFRKTFIASLTL